MKKYLYAITVALLSVGSYTFLGDDVTEFLQDNFSKESSDVSTAGFIQDSGSIQVYFCPGDQCNSALVDFLDSAQESIHCAMFEIDLPDVRQKLLEKANGLNGTRQVEVQIVTDNDYLYEFNHSFVKTDSYGLMHNKFCIVDGKKISTGSMNPTVNCAFKNNNNILLIESELLARNYEDEFEEMWNGTFKKGSRVEHPSIILNQTEINIYFCPEDDCAEKVKEELEKVQKTIHFMTFSFTNEKIANVLLMKNLENISVSGVMEARQVSKYSVFNQLKQNGIAVFKDKNPANMHHKVFIIDSEVVITGSFNPTSGGDNKNDENVLIIKDKVIAQLFEEEFRKVYAEANVE